jgi:outer membrane protein OmpA-like peptidoglycan-associated protein
MERPFFFAGTVTINYRCGALRSPLSTMRNLFPDRILCADYSRPGQQVVRFLLSYRLPILAQAMLLCMACSALGQEDTTRYHLFVGLFGGIGGGIEVADIAPPGFSPTCGTLRSGTSFGWRAGALVERPLSRRIALQLRLGLGRTSGSMSVPIPGSWPVWLDDGVREAIIDHRVDFKATALEGSLMMRWGLTDRLHAQGAIGLGRWIADDLSYRQVAIEPEELLFANNSREIVIVPSDAYRPAQILVGLEAGVAYDLPISRHSTLSPEITAFIPITSRTPDGPWRSYALHAGAALRFGIPRAETPPPPPPPDSPQIVVRNPTLVTAVATEPRVVSVQIDEHDSLEMLSLLNQIYFAEGASTLRSSYRQLTAATTEGFSDTTLLGSALDVYYDILNIVGYRMREAFPDAVLTVNGYRSGGEPSGALARQRAESIRRYLTDVWKIAPNRIKVKGGGTPPSPSRENTREGLEENARAELSASDPNVLGPILRRHIIRTATPPSLVFYPQALAEAGVDHWNLETLAEGTRPWRTFSGRGKPPDSIVWNWQNDDGELPTLPMHLVYRLSVTDSAGRTTTTATTDIEVAYHSMRHKLENRQNDTTIETYSLLLFDFDSPKVSRSDRDLLELIASIIRSKASVRLVGYTDSLGDARHNRELATERARDVERVLRRLLPRDVSITVDESGGEHERFPFNTPEGRSHCRTVFIDVRTPTLPDGS